MNKIISTGLVLGACLWCMGCVPAHEEDQQSSTEYLAPPGDGWVNVAPGVWEREDSEHSVETYAVGAAGLRWMMPQLEWAGDTLQQVYEREPTQEHQEQLLGHEQMMAEVAQTLAQPEQAPAKNDQTLKCEVYFSGNADAYPRPISPGTKATANATYQTTCGGFSGGVYTYTYATADSQWQASGCGWRYGAATSCSSTSSMSGYSSCYSYALAQVKDQAGVTYTWSRDNYSCESYGGGGGGGQCDPPYYCPIP